MPTTEGRPLVVDDEPDCSELLSTLLQVAGFEMHTAADGAEVVRHAEATRPGLVVLDTMLPDLDTFTVTRPLREVGRDALVLFLEVAPLLHTRRGVSYMLRLAPTC